MDKHIDELSKADIDRVLNSAEIHYKKGSVVAGIVVRLISMLEATNERAKKAELELIKPLPIGELIHRLEGQTYRKWYDDDELNKMRERAEAAEARLLVPVKLPSHLDYQGATRLYRDAVEKHLRASGYPVEGGE